MLHVVIFRYQPTPILWGEARKASIAGSLKELRALFQIRLTVDASTPNQIATSFCDPRFSAQFSVPSFILAVNAETICFLSSEVMSFLYACWQEIPLPRPTPQPILRVLWVSNRETRRVRGLWEFFILQFQICNLAARGGLPLPDRVFLNSTQSTSLPPHHNIDITHIIELAIPIHL